jgi:hypothetical protein
MSLVSGWKAAQANQNVSRTRPTASPVRECLPVATAQLLGQVGPST